MRAAWPYLALIIFMPAFAILQSAWEGTLPLPRDLAPDTQVDASPYRAPAGCPARIWSVDEFLPKACLTGNTYAATANHVGLEPTLSGPRAAYMRHQRLWVRQDADALAVVCAAFADCKVIAVVRNRFSETAPLAREARAPTVDYRQEPLRYTVIYWLQIVLWALPAVVIWLAVTTNWERLRGRMT